MEVTKESGDTVFAQILTLVKKTKITKQERPVLFKI